MSGLQEQRADGAVNVPSMQSRPGSAGSALNPRGQPRGFVRAALGVSVLNSSGNDNVEMVDATRLKPGRTTLQNLLERADRRLALLDEEKSANKKKKPRAGGATTSPGQYSAVSRDDPSSTNTTPAVSRPVSRLTTLPIRSAATSPPPSAASSQQPLHRGVVSSSSIVFDTSSWVPGPRPVSQTSYTRSALTADYPMPSGSTASHRRSVSSPYEWIYEKRQALKESAAPLSTPQPATYATVPRTLVDRAIRWKGFRAASALARAFEIAPSTEEILEQGSIHLAPKLL